MSLRHQALAALITCEPQAKVAATIELQSRFSQVPPFELPEAERIEVISLTSAQQAHMPGHPALPKLVSATRVPTRSAFTVDGRAALLHAICHIEFNAINLALDAVWRFAGMPSAFYTDWLRVAHEEALHFTLLRTHLQSMGWDYGDFDAHDGLWFMCEKTQSDILGRMALVPRTLEARGLDATPLIQDKLSRAGDARAVEILDIILRDEIGHVAVGNHWFHHLCTQRGLDAIDIYPKLIKQYDAPRMRPPFNEAARKAAGFTDAEMAFLLGDA